MPSDGAPQRCAAYAELGISAIMPRAGLCRLGSSPDEKVGESRGLFVV